LPIFTLVIVQFQRKLLENSHRKSPNMSAVTSAEQNFIVSVIQMVRQKITSGTIKGDEADSLEGSLPADRHVVAVAIQCLETGFAITEANYAFQPSRPILDTFVQAEGLSASEVRFPDPSTMPCGRHPRWTRPTRRRRPPTRSRTRATSA